MKHLTDIPYLAVFLYMKFLGCFKRKYMLHQVCIIIMIYSTKCLNILELRKAVHAYFLDVNKLMNLINCHQYFYSADLRRPTSCSVDDGI